SRLARKSSRLTGALLLERLNELSLFALPEVSPDASLTEALAREAEASAMLVTRWCDLHGWIAAAQDATHGRKSSGAYATPLPFARALVACAMAPIHHGKLPSVIDPSCGAGALLLQALRRLRSGANDSKSRINAVRCVYGIELDPVARELACLLLTI